jgi:tyrosyl-tRNA synthetase
MITTPTKEERIKNLLERNVAQIIDRGHLEAKLRSGKKLRVKLGIDPTSPDLHLGHAVVLRKLREFQDLGHTVVLIIGDFTALIGDPSGRDKTRPPLAAGEIQNNFKKYAAQAGRVLDVKKTKIRRNSEWLGTMKSPAMLRLLGSVSVQQIMEREDFQKRYAEHRSIQIHEMVYPLLQGEDSVVVKPDVELGGTDQTFNLLIGRTLMEKAGMDAQDIMTVPLLVGLDGVKKMSKSLGNYIALDDGPADMFGKVMSIPDSLVADYFKFCTALADDDIKKILKPLVTGGFSGSGWKDAKQRLAFEITKLYHGERMARAAQENFEKTFSKREAPGDAPVLILPHGTTALAAVIVSGVVASKSDARRLIQQGGFDFGGVTVRDPNQVLDLTGEKPMKVGKKGFFRARLRK